VAVAQRHGEHFPVQWLINSGELTAQTRHDIAALWDKEALETSTAFGFATCTHAETY